MKIAIYTAIFGGYDGLISQPKLKDVDFICYTDRDLKSKSWNIIKVEPPIKDDNTRSNRFYKILPHKHLNNYDVSIYIDGNILVTQDVRKLVENKLSRVNMACFDHNQNYKDPRNCIYKEYEAILELGEKKGNYKDDPETMKKQMDRFKQEGYPENNGLITAPVLIRRHFAEDVIEVMETWWDIVLNESKRDQLSFNYAAWKHQFDNIELIDGDVRTGNPWFYTLGSHRKNYTKKRLEYQFKKLFGKL